MVGNPMPDYLGLQNWLSSQQIFHLDNFKVLLCHGRRQAQVTRSWGELRTSNVTI